MHFHRFNTLALKNALEIDSDAWSISPMTQSSIPKTVFVLGAGASYNIGLPLGDGLKTLIGDALNFRHDDTGRLRGGDPMIYEALQIATRNRSKLGEKKLNFNSAAKLIHGGMPLAKSIDNFINQHSEDPAIELCGKLGITKIILEKEKSSQLSLRSYNNSPTLDFAGLEGSWFNLFFQMLTEHCGASSLESRFQSIAFVIFNYDRCFEHYLFYALQQSYAMSSMDTAAKMKFLEIIHPYGRVGSLPWQNESNPVEFGAKPNAHKLLDLTSQIKTFTEGTDRKSADYARIIQIVSEAKRLVFLGFAYLPLNLDLLIPDRVTRRESPTASVFGSAYGMSQSDTDMVSLELRHKLDLLPGNVMLNNGLNCATLLSEYSRRLSLLE